MPVWNYQTSKGKFWIKPQGNGRFLLGIDDEGLGSYITPKQAADDVYCCATGYYPWDALMIVDQPADLSEWNYLPQSNLWSFNG